MKLYLAGTEIPAYRSLLAQEGHTTVALSYWGLRRRTKFTKPYDLAEKFGDEMEILVDSGCHSINTKPAGDLSDAELKDIAEHYYASFIAPNRERLAYYVEFDAHQLGDEWITQQRERLHRDKAIVVWRPETGREGLEQLCRDWPNVGITQAGVDRLDVSHLLAHLSKTTDTRLFGLGMTKTAALEHGLWYGAASTSWLSPSQFGDTIVWAGKELHRYPRRYKDMARNRHKHAITDAGFDADAVLSDDPTEVLRVSIWSWNQFTEHVNGRGVTAPAKPRTAENADQAPEAVDRLPEQVRHAGVTPAVVEQREKRPFPGLAVVQDTAEDGTLGRPVLKTVDPGVRTCDRCYLSSSCPASQPKSACAFSLPVEIRTKDQRADVAAALLEMQAGRVFNLRFAEELEGGITNPVLSGELDRFQKMLKAVGDMEENSFSVKITATQKGAAESGLISRLFGRDEGEQARSLPEPVTVERAAIETGFVDAEVIEDKAA
ncbi:hypothetical protein [Streptomyces sp. CB03238]|uniref:hypothetical protein n=1 Tax=Streptomyces sp. CB03238 TaxID=1907777 RepID=UPI000A11C7BE|nr:hypothetical protein [Streptomyces sp. CB03238]ORT58233.1 hypothetical protein BKD26_20230 [Streptomyces sp. CB03238]